MKGQVEYYLCCILLVSAIGTSGVKAQILYDSTAVEMIKLSVSHIYNMESEKAREEFSEIEHLYPDHPVIYLLKGFMTYWENYPLIPGSPECKVFEENLHSCSDLSIKKPYSENFEAESVLANICARGMLLMFYADNDLTFNVIPLAAGSYKYLIRSFDFASAFADFSFFTGLYNYYREAYPEIHPVYKAIASVFPHGDMKKGLNELEKSARMSVFLKAESYGMLTWIYAGYENNFPKALSYSSTLTDLYPKNPMFKAYNIKNLLLLKEYDQAETIIEDYRKDIPNTFFDAQIMVFNGIIQEKKYRNYPLAKQFYEGGIGAISMFGDYGNDYVGFAYLGLSRISGYMGDKASEKAFRKKGLDLSSFKQIDFD